MERRTWNEQIKIGVQTRNMTWHQLYHLCQIKTYKQHLAFMDTIQQLQIQGQIYQYEKNKFMPFPAHYHIGNITKEGNQLYLLLEDHKIELPTSVNHYCLEDDTVVVEQDSETDCYHIKRIIKRNLEKIEPFLIQKLQERNLTYKQLKHLARAYTHQDSTYLTELLKKLEIEGKILKDDKHYLPFPTQQAFVTKLKATTSNELYYEQDGHQCFLTRDMANQFLDQDVVMINKQTHQIEKLIHRQANQYVYEVIEENNVKKLKLISFLERQNVHARIGSLDFKKLKIGERVLVNISSDKSESDTYEATYIATIGHKNEPDIELKTIAASKGFHLTFNESCLKEAAAIPQEVSAQEAAGRYDFRDKNIFTIDCDHTKDIDDAVSVERLNNGNYLLGVHIANVSHYVKPGSALYEEAKQRSTSLYMLNTVIPMLPPALSNGICSLNPGVDRLAKSCLMEIDPTGNIVQYDIVDSIIRSKLKMNYHDVNGILQANIVPTAYLPFVKDLKTMQELSDILTLHHVKNGSLHFANSDVEAILDEHNKPIDFRLNEQGNAGKIIENFMISANQCVDQYLSFLPGANINRIHEAPEEKDVQGVISKLQMLGYKVKNNVNLEPKYRLQGILKSYMGTKDFPIVSKICLTSMKVAKYSTENQGHFGLGVRYYTHFTSPIRRFPDLRTHLLLDQYQYGSIIDFPMLEQELNLICEHSSYMERQADAAEKQALISKMMDYIDQHLQQPYQGIVTDMNQDKIFVKTTNHIPGYVDCHQLRMPVHLSPLKKMMINEEKAPILRVGHEVALRSIGSDRSSSLANFTLEDNLTLAKNGNNSFQKTLRRAKFQNQ